MTLRNLADFIDSCVRVPAAGVHAYLHPQARDTINFGRFLLDYLSWHLVSMSMAMIVLRATAALWIGMWWVQKFGVSFSMVMSKRVRDVEQKERLDTAILEFVILRGSLLSCCKVLVHARCHVQRPP